MLGLDHLVVGAASLAQGVAWCEATLGVTPAPGGAHPLMGTHNRLLRIDGHGFPRAYLEIIAIDAAAPPPGRVRWFDLDDAALQARLARGPALIHWVARVDDLDAACAAWRAGGIDRGEMLAASRGTLRWRIAVRPDGARLAQGQWPTLIEWGDAHPCDSLPASPVVLRELTVRALPAPLREALPDGIAVAPEPGAPLEAVLATPLGECRLTLPGD
ncbi:VOC family protein [Piscinibacter defluvii]|uniref:VOC family protein n=1 Tax=Piscinibacter defluvii TaxID=1796922 RepID=UPI000FDE0913|nr:VOC family protein [Piscinibacter defluvii]